MRDDRDLPHCAMTWNLSAGLEEEGSSSPAAPRAPVDILLLCSTRRPGRRKTLKNGCIPRQSERGTRLHVHNPVQERLGGRGRSWSRRRAGLRMLDSQDTTQAGSPRSSSPTPKMRARTRESCRHLTKRVGKYGSPLAPCVDLVHASPPLAP